MSKRAELLNTAGTPIEVRNGIARFEDGTRIAYRPVELRANTAVELVDEASGKKTRKVEVIWTKGASVLRYSWCDDEIYEEQLVVDEQSVDLGRLRNGGSVLNSHSSWDLGDVIGTVLDVRIADGVGYATIQISNRASCDELWQDIQDGIVRHISVGYSVLKTETIREEGQTTIRKVTLWEPHEISFVAVPADAGCSVRSNTTTSNSTRNTETTVPQNIQNETPATPAETAAEIAQRGADARELEFRRIAARFRMPEAEVTTAISNAALTADEFRNAQIDALAERAANTNVVSTRASVTGETTPAMELALRSEMFTAEMLGNYGIGGAQAPSERAQQYAGEGLRGAALTFLRGQGVTGMDGKSDTVIIAAALERSVGGGFVTGDFLGMVTSPAIVALDNGYREELQATTYQNWTGELKQKDGNIRQAFTASLFTGIGRVTEDGELPLASFSGSTYQATFTTSGIEIVAGRLMLINDDLGAFYANLRDLGASWGQYNERRALRTLLDGTLTQDGTRKKIFSAQAGNVIDVAALDVDGLKAGADALRAQRTDPKLGGTLLSARAAYLFVGSGNMNLADVLMDPRPSLTRTDINPFAGKVEVVEIPEMDDNVAILAGRQGLKNMIKRVSLAGQNGPQLERMAQVSSQRIVWHSYEDADFVGASHLGAVKLNIT